MTKDVEIKYKIPSWTRNFCSVTKKSPKCSHKTKHLEWEDRIQLWKRKKRKKKEKPLSIDSIYNNF
jgi:hypothetical protein